MTTAGGTVLHWAAATGDRDMLAFLLERALDPNSRSYTGQTPLHVAAGRGHDPCVRLLLSDNAQPDLGALAAPGSSSASAGPLLQNCPACLSSANCPQAYHPILQGCSLEIARVCGSLHALTS